MLKSLAKIKFKKPDLVLLGTLGALLVLGLLILSSVSSSFAYKHFGDTYHFLKAQLFWLAIGLAIGFLAYKIDLSKLKKWAPKLFLGNLILMILVFFPIIGSAGEASARWIHIGGFSFQPSEFLKLTFILYLASFLAARSEKTGENNKVLRPFIYIISTIILIAFFQKDLSTFGLVAIIGAIMYFLAKTPIKHSGLLVLLGIVFFVLMVNFSLYRIERIDVWLNPELDLMGSGYQAKQAEITVGSGGLFGAGYGMSSQKFGLLPESISDAVFAVYAEEAGFAGSLILIFLFLFFAWRGMKISKESGDRFAQLVTAGITCWIVLQAFVNIGAMIRILPLTGIPMPFVSYGGTALISELIAMGILLNISKK